MKMTFDQFKALVQNIDLDAVAEKARQQVLKGKANNTQIALLYSLMQLSQALENLRDGKAKNDALIEALAEAMSELMDKSPEVGRRVAQVLDAHMPPECPQENTGAVSH